MLRVFGSCGLSSGRLSWRNAPWLWRAASSSDEGKGHGKVSEPTACPRAAGQQDRCLPTRAADALHRPGDLSDPQPAARSPRDPRAGRASHRQPISNRACRPSCTSPQRTPVPRATSDRERRGPGAALPRMRRLRAPIRPRRPAPARVAPAWWSPVGTGQRQRCWSRSPTRGAVAASPIRLRRCPPPRCPFLAWRAANPTRSGVSASQSASRL